MCVLELRVTHGVRTHAAFAELAGRDGRPAAEISVMHRKVHVRESRAAVQRSKAAAIVCVDTGNAEAPAIPPIPGMETVTRSKGKPADRAPAATEAETTAVERNISRRPYRAVVRISVGRTRPPGPRSVVHHPATIVIRSPAPGIIRNPGRTPVRLIHPAAVAIRSPAGFHVWTPHLTVIRNFRPGAVAVEIFGSHVVVVSVSPRYRIADDVVAIGVPLVPVIPGRCFADLVLRLIAGTLHGDELTLSHARAALRSRNFHFPTADQHFGVIVGGHQNSKAGFAAARANGNVGRIDFGVRIAVLKDGVVRHAASKLNLNLRAGELGDVGLRMLRETEHVGIVELKFGARFVAGRNAVTREDGSIERSRGPAARVATLRGNVAMNQTDARYASVCFSRSAGTLVAEALVVGAWLCRALIHGTLIH